MATELPVSKRMAVLLVRRDWTVWLTWRMTRGLSSPAAARGTSGA